MTGYVPTLTIVGAGVILAALGTSWLYPSKMEPDESKTDVIGAFKVFRLYGVVLLCLVNGMMYTVLFPLLALYLQEVRSLFREKWFIWSQQFHLKKNPLKQTRRLSRPL